MEVHRFIDLGLRIPGSKHGLDWRFKISSYILQKIYDSLSLSGFADIRLALWICSVIFGNKSLMVLRLTVADGLHSRNLATGVTFVDGSSTQ